MSQIKWGDFIVFALLLFKCPKLSGETLLFLLCFFASVPNSVGRLYCLCPASFQVSKIKWGDFIVFALLLFKCPKLSGETLLFLLCFFASVPNSVGRLYCLCPASFQVSQIKWGDFIVFAQLLFKCPKLSGETLLSLPCFFSSVQN